MIVFSFAIFYSSSVVSFQSSLQFEVDAGFLSYAFLFIRLAFSTPQYLKVFALKV